MCDCDCNDISDSCEFSFSNSLQEKLAKNIEASGNLALELKNATETLVNSIKRYKEIYDYVSSLEEPNEEEKMDEMDSWGEMLHNIMFYDEVKRAMSKQTEVEKMIGMVKRQHEVNDG